MINFIVITVALILDLLALTGLYIYTSIGVTLIASITSLAVFAIWIGVTVCEVGQAVRDQLADLNKLEQQDKLKNNIVEGLKKDKTTNERSLEKYKEESKVALVDNYKEFEQTLMRNIQDSKLLAAVLQESGYAKVLSEYHKNIVKLTDRIRNCDLNISSNIFKYDENKLIYIRNMFNRQGQGIFGYHFFFPKRLIYKEERET